MGLDLQVENWDIISWTIIFRAGASGEIPGFDDVLFRPQTFRYLYAEIQKCRQRCFERFLTWLRVPGGASRQGWQRNVKNFLVMTLKIILATPGPWVMGFTGFGETLPYHENKITLNKQLLDKWGQPTLTIDCEFKENEAKMDIDMDEFCWWNAWSCRCKNIKAK